MIKRTLEISQQPVHLTVRDEQLLLLRKNDAPRRLPAEPEGLLAAIPCEDIGLLLVEQQGTTYSHAALTKLLEHDAALVVCGRNHLPAGLLLPLGRHTEVVWRIQDQLAVKKPLKKQLWRQLVQAKVRAQAANLPPGSPARSRLLGLARQVRSGDPSNVEAQAARAYWSALFAPSAHLLLSDGLGQGGTQEGEADTTGDPPFAFRHCSFRRDPDGDGLNALLNYGYAVVRAAVARALVMAGLLPALGLHHANRSNAFCLADDLMEPLRPLVDARVRALAAAGQTDLTPETKKELLGVLTAEVCVADQTGPLLVALHRMVASLVRCFEGTGKRLDIPAAYKTRATQIEGEGTSRRNATRTRGPDPSRDRQGAVTDRPRQDAAPLGDPAPPDSGASDS